MSMSGGLRTLRRSLWLLWLGTVLFSWVAFVHVGLRTRHRPWVLWGLVYGTPLVAFFTAEAALGPHSGPADFAIGCVIVSAVVSSAHALAIRRQAEARIAACERRERAEIAAFDAPVVATGPLTALVVPPPDGVVDVNTAGADALALLPGVGLMGAEIAVRLRASNGPFHSADQFGEALGLGPVLLDRLRPWVQCGPGLVAAPDDVGA